MIYLIIIGLIFYLIKSLDFVYLFQTKEYRFDRFTAFLRENNLLELAYLRGIRLPALSVRNLLIIWGNFTNLLPLYFLLSKLHFSYVILFIFLAPIAALFSSLLGVLISEIPVQIYRRTVISRAKKKVIGSKTVFIGITGSYGKTTTKEYLFQILSRKFRVAKTEKNFNSEIGVAVSILKNLKTDTEFFIAEMGAYRKGEIKAICDLVHPRYGIITAIGNQHLALFGSLHTLVKTKAELLESLPENGTAYLNRDLEHSLKLVDNCRAKIHYYSLADFTDDPQLNSLEDYQIQNLLPCFALAHDLGLSRKEIHQALEELKPVEGRLSESTGLNGSRILNDSYNSNVDGFLLAIEKSSRIKAADKYLISRGLIELGEEKKASYKKIIAKLHHSRVKLLTTDRLFKHLDLGENVSFFKNETKLLAYLKEITGKDSLITVEGRFEPKTLKILFNKN